MAPCGHSMDFCLNCLQQAQQLPTSTAHHGSHGDRAACVEHLCSTDSTAAAYKHDLWPGSRPEGRLPAGLRALGFRVQGLDLNPGSRLEGRLHLGFRALGT